MPGLAVVIVTAGILAAWLAAGSVGWLAPALQKIACWILLGIAVLASRPRQRDAQVRWALLTAAAAIGAILMTASVLSVVNVLGVTVMLSAIGATQPGVASRAILVTALAVTVLALFRLANDSIATAWAATDLAGRLLGSLAGWVTGGTLHIGASFGGVDFLVLMAAIYAGWLVSTAPPRRARAVWAGVAILLAHFTYLTVLAFSHDLESALPAIVRPSFTDVSLLGVWTWGNAMHGLLPWGLPALAAVFHAAVAAAMFRLAAWQPVGSGVVSPTRQAGPSRRPRDAEPQPVRADSPRDVSLAGDAIQRFGPAALAVIIALAIVLAPGKADLKGRRIVTYETGLIDWTMPEGVRPVPRSAQMFGMLPRLVESLGGQFVRSTDLAEKDLAEADVVVVLPPGQDWQRDDASGGLVPQEVQERLWQFVRRGGAVLVAAEPETHRGAAENVLNELLAPTAIRARDDMVLSVTENWEHNYQAASHAATAGIDTGQNRFGLDHSVSLRTHWPAGPLVAGRWAWSNPGADPTPVLGAQYESGQRLGDLVLAAQQRLGQGVVVVLGDASCLMNEKLASSYLFAGRLLCSLAGKADGPLTLWRQLLGLLATAGLVGLLAVYRTDASQQVVAAIVVAGAVFGCTAASDSTAELLPEGRPQSARPVAYIDGSHLEAFSSATWRPAGLGELTRILMRNGYLPLVAPDLTPARLSRAAMWISIAPARPFTATERKTLQEFVENGAIAISMAGALEAEPSRPLLRDFHLDVPTLPVAPSQVVREPAPLGAFRQTYGSSTSESYVQFYAAWPVEADSSSEDLVSWADDARQYPAITSQRLGRGVFVLIGDTCFAMNKNLEAEAGAVNENVPFWRWLLAHVTGRKEPAEPKPDSTKRPATKAAAAPPAASKPEAIEPAESGPLSTPAPARTDKKGVTP